MRPLFRIVALVAVTAAFNLLLYLYVPGAVASHQNRYAVVTETTYDDYSAILGQIYTGSPGPVPAGTFSNQTLWAVNSANCSGLSWVESGWTKKGTDPIRLKFIYKVPSTNSCTYTEELYESPQSGSYHVHRLEYCSSGCNPLTWSWSVDQQLRRTLKVGWSITHYLQAGGEVGGHYTGIGMSGGINTLQYRRASTWYNFYYADSYRCDYGYSLIWNGSNNILDWGYNPPGGCPA